MRITLKLFASLAEFLPPGAERNQVEREVPDGSTVADVLEHFAVPIPKCHLILVNGIFAPPARARSTELRSGDVLAVWPQVAGG